MPKYCDVKPILHLLADKDLLDTVNVGAVLQALQHGLYNGEVRPVVHAHWEDCSNGWMCSNCYRDRTYETDYCPNCGAKMDEVIE